MSLIYSIIEKQLEDEEELEKKLNQEKKKTFADEDQVDSDDERKKTEEEKKAQALDKPTDGKKKPKTKDYDEMFETRLSSSKGNASQQKVQEIQSNSKLSREAKDQQLAMVAEQDITESLFADMAVSSASLNTEKDYVSFGKKVGEVLYQGQAPYRIPSFFKELVRDLSKNIEAKKVKEILDSVTAIYNEKVREEKDKEKTGKGNAAAKAKASLKDGKALQNQKMMTDLMGDDDYGDEDEYGAEGEAGTKKAGKGKVAEEEYDFM